MRQIANNKISDVLNQEYSKLIKRVSGLEHPITFGSPINVLLIGGSLSGCAKGLAEILQDSTDIKVDSVNDPADADRIIYEKPIDFLITVGALENKEDYRSVELFNHINRYSSAIMFGQLDDLLVYELCAHGFSLGHNIFSSVDKLISSMRKLYHKKTAHMHEDFSPKTTRKYIREKILANYSLEERIKAVEAAEAAVKAKSEAEAAIAKAKVAAAIAAEAKMADEMAAKAAVKAAAEAVRRNKK